MELTPEERRKIYEEEKSRLQAGQPEQNPNPLAPLQQSTSPGKKITYNQLVLLSIVLVVVVLALIFNNISRPTREGVVESNVNSRASSKSASSGITDPPTDAAATTETGENDFFSRIEAEGGSSEDAIRENIQAVDKTITYEHLKKNAERYIGKPWAFTGKIFQIQESGNQTTALVSLDPYGSKNVWVAGNFTTDLVENNQVYVVGYLAGDYSYKSVANYNLTIPAVAARAMMKPSEAAKYKLGKAGAKD